MPRVEPPPADDVTSATPPLLF